MINFDKKMKNKIFFVIFVLFTVQCGVRIDKSQEVRITQKPKRIDESYFSNLKIRYNLKDIDSIWDDLSALKPSYPMAWGIKQYAYDSCLFVKGCSMPRCFGLLVLKDTSFIFLQTLQDVQNFFAPIESVEEALSYAILVTGKYSRYNFLIPVHFRKYVYKIKSTYSIEKNDYFEVGLFDYAVCGCGPHNYFSVIVKIKKTGEIISKEYHKLYSDPLENGLCVD